jgi:hypothetical protein
VRCLLEPSSSGCNRNRLQSAFPPSSGVLCSVPIFEMVSLRGTHSHTKNARTATPLMTSPSSSAVDDIFTGFVPQPPVLTSHEMQRVCEARAFFLPRPHKNKWGPSYRRYSICGGLSPGTLYHDLIKKCCERVGLWLRRKSDSRMPGL